jgi:molybdopterin/thiamine biosynthesis adenylyltransferase/rhodanese-related sulfurtransferase
MGCAPHEPEEIAPGEARELQRRGALLVDVRDAPELLSGMPAGAVHVPRCDVANRMVELAPDRGQTLLLICGSGRRSLSVARQLRELGYADARSVAGGIERWRSQRLPTVLPSADAGDVDVERYARQLTLPEVGLAGQRALQQARVLLVGAGGLGCPASLYLAVAGVGHLTLVDDDRVERSNLHRQVLHGERDRGRPKVESGAAALLELNPRVDVTRVATRVDATNAHTLLAGQQLVIDGSDNFPTRYAVNDACVALGIPLVHGSVFRFEGQVSVFWPGRPGRPGPCYRCLYAEAPPADLAPSCAEAGVLGVLPGVIGLLQATEAFKLLLGIGEPLVGRLLHYDALRSSFEEFEVSRDPECRTCGR